LTNANGIGGTPAWTNLIAENAVGAPAFAGWPADYNVGANRGILAETGTPNLYYLNNANGLGGTTSYTHITPSSGAGVTPTWGLAYDSPSDRTMTWYQSGSNLSYYLAPASSSIFGQSVTFTANVNVIAPGAGSPTGTIQFFDGVTPIGGAQPVLGGAASVSTSSLVVNVHNITATYNGDASFTTSASSPLSHTVTQAATTTTVTSSANPSTYGDSVTFTSTTVNGITPVNEGTVTFIEGATCASPTTILQAATLVGTSGPNTGKATFTTSALTVPSHTVTACYAGTNFATSNGNVTQTVNPANQTISVTTPAPANAVFGTNFNVAATGGASGNAVTIAGSGACSGSGNNSATITMTSGTGTCTVTYNQAGNSNYNAAPQVTSNTTAAKATQTITFNALAGKIYGDASFGVSATASSGLVVSFSSDTATVCSLTGSTVSILAAGTCTVRALQVGNGNYSAATDVTQSFTVGQKTLTPSISAGNKVYDGNTSATFTCSLAGVVGLDDVSCTGGTAVFADKNKGTGKTVTATGLALSGTKAANYSLSPTSASTTADITARPITVTATTNTKVFDGTTSAAAVPTIYARNACRHGHGNIERDIYRRKRRNEQDVSSRRFDLRRQRRKQLCGDTCK
jgi:hypothetical protein